MNINYSDIIFNCFDEDSFEYEIIYGDNRTYAFIEFDLDNRKCEFIMNPDNYPNDYPRIKIGESHSDSNNKIIEEFKCSVIGYLIGIGEIILN